MIYHQLLSDWSGVIIDDEHQEGGLTSSLLVSLARPLLVVVE